MPSKGSTIAIVVAMASALLCSCAIAIWFMMTQGKSSTRGLPSTPAQAPNVSLNFGGMKATLQDVINYMFDTKSECWHVNHYMRVTLANLYIKYSDMVENILRITASAGGAMPTAKAMKELGPRFKELLRELQDALRELLNCPGDATMTVRLRGVDDAWVTVNVHQSALEMETTLAKALELIG